MKRGHKANYCSENWRDWQRIQRITASENHNFSATLQGTGGGVGKCELTLTNCGGSVWITLRVKNPRGHQTFVLPLASLPGPFSEYREKSLCASGR